MTSPFSTVCLLSCKTNTDSVSVQEQFTKRRQNVAGTLVTQSALPCLPLFCSYHIMNVSCDLLLNRGTAT